MFQLNMQLERVYVYQALSMRAVFLLWLSEFPDTSAYTPKSMNVYYPLLS